MSTVKREKTPDEALAALMRLAARAEKSSGDARRLMHGWGVPKADQEAVIERLTAQKFIDDERYAAAYVREKVRFSGWGAYKIRAALAAKGIAREIVESAVESIDQGAMDERLETYLRRKLPSVKADSDYELRTKLMRYGLSLGYEYEKVGEAIDKLKVESGKWKVTTQKYLRVLILCLSLSTFNFQLSTIAAQPADFYRSPMDIPVYLSANFGEIRTNRFHTGVDIKTQGVVGKPVYAVADGYVSRVTVAPAGYGRALYINHSNGTMSVYGHLDRFTPEVEEWLRAERYRRRHSDIDAFPPAMYFPVKKGERIGFAGNSGASSGPHLHFEVRRLSDSRTLNVRSHGWLPVAEEDKIAPRITKLYAVDVDTLAGVPVHSAPRAYEVRLNADGNYSLVRTGAVKVGPAGWFAVEVTDRMTGVANTFGVCRVRMAVDGVETVVFEKDEVRFADIRYACASVLYDIQRETRNEVVMLATKDGNRLPMYKKAAGRGVLRLGEGERRDVEITVGDDAGNAVRLSFAVERDEAHILPERPAGVAASNRREFSRSENGMTVTIPAGALYEPIFYTQEVVEMPVQPRTDSIRPLSPLHRTGDGALPLHSAMKLSIAADIPEAARPRACLAKVSGDGRLSYAGGGYSDGAVVGSARDFGVFCAACDTIPPVVKASFAGGADLSRAASFTLTATDNFSGIADFTGSIDGEWIIFERTASRGQFTHRFDPGRLTMGRNHTLEFTVRDGAGNKTVLNVLFFK